MLISLIGAGASPLIVAGALRGAAAADRRHRGSSVDVVWTGRNSEITTSRVTAAAISEMLDAAIIEVLVIGYAVHDDPLVSDALARATQHNVGITLLLEREIDTRATTNTVSRSQDCGPAGSPGRQLIAPRPAPHSMRRCSISTGTPLLS